MIEIKQLTKKSLLEYIQSSQFGEGDAIPISMHRALSQMQNPKLGEEDTMLLLAVENDNLLGYLGLLPDTISIHNELPYKVIWLSCMWVSQQARGKGISMQLIQKSFELGNKNILLADYVPFTKTIYDKTHQFNEEPYSKKGIRLYIKADFQHILPPKNAFLGKLTGIFKAIDYSVNMLLNLRLSFYKEDVSQLIFEYSDQIDDEVNDFIISKQATELFKRQKDDLNWIIQHPWILSADEKDALNTKYYFSSTAKTFNFYALKIRNADNRLIAFMIFSKRENTLKLPYLYHDNCIDTVIKVLNYHIIKWKINTFTSYHSELAQTLMNKKTPAIYKKVTQRNYMISSALKNTLFHSNHDIQDGDGDCVFT